MMHREFNTPALRLAVIRPRTDPNQEKNIHIHHSANAERLIRGIKYKIRTNTC